MNDKKTFLNYHLSGVLDDLSDMVKNPYTSHEAYYQPLKQVVELLSQGASINTQNKRGETLLHLACYSVNPLYGIEVEPLFKKFENQKHNLRDLFKTPKIAFEILGNYLAYPFSKTAPAKRKLASLRLKAVFNRIQNRGPKDVFLPIEKIVSTYHPNPFIIDKRLNTPAMALTKRLRSPLAFEKDTYKLSEDQAAYKYEELNILSAYEASFQAKQTSRALKSLMALAGLTDFEKKGVDKSKLKRDIIFLTEHPQATQEEDSVHPTKDTKRLISQVISSCNKLYGIPDGNSNQKED